MHRPRTRRRLAVRGWALLSSLAVTALISGCVTIQGLPGASTATFESLQTPGPEIATPIATTVPTKAPVPTETPQVTAAPATPEATPEPTPELTPAASSGFDPTSEEALVSSMLDVVDVDPAAETSGVDVGTDADDLPAFAEQGGLRRAAQTISVGTDYTVYDFRYQFPTADAAASFLEAEADSLGETDFLGVESEPPLQMGDETRYYTSHLDILGVVQDTYNYLIRVENVVAKVWVGGDPEFITAAEADHIATTAWGRMTIVFDPSEIEGNPI